MEKAPDHAKSVEAILSELLGDQESISDDLSARLRSLIEGYEAKVSSSAAKKTDSQEVYESLTGMVAPYLAEGLVLVHMETGQILYTNPRLDEMYGWEPGALIGKSIAVLNSPNGYDPEAIAQSVITSVQTEERWKGELLGVRKDGTDFWVLVSAGILDHPEFGRVQVSTQLDISKRKRDETRYRSLFEQSGDAVILYNLDGIVIAANPRSAEMTGYALDELIGLHTRDLIHESEIESMLALRERLLAGERTEVFERVAKRRDGTDYYIEVDTVLVYDEHGEPAYLQSVARDITRKKLNEARYRALFTYMHDGALIFDLDQVVLAANPQAAALTGYRVEELKGMHVSELVDPGETEHSNEIRRRLFAGEAVSTYERIVKKKNGDRIYVEVSSSLVLDDNGQPLQSQAIFRDITERKRSDARYRALFEHTHDMVILYNVDGSITAANEQAALTTGYTVDELVGMKIKDLVDPREHPDLKPTLERLISGERLSLFERLAVKKSGERYFAEVSMSLVPGQGDHPPYIQAIARDITDRKLSEARYHALFDKVQDAVIMYDVEGIIIAANEQAGEMIGYPVDELIGMQIRDLIAEREVKSMQGLRERLLAGESIGIFERVAKRSDGSEYQVEIDMSLVELEEGSPPYIQSIVRDITERKREQARFQALFERNNDAVTFLDLDGRITAANPKAVELTGYSHDELIGKHAWEMVTDEEASSSKDRHQRFVQGVGVPVYERTAHHKNGEEYIVEVSASLVTDAEGNPLHVQSMFRDITERKLSEVRYRALFDHTHDAILIIDLEGNIQTANPRAAEMLGYSLEELAKIHVRDIVPESERTNASQRMQAILAGEILPIYERVAQRKNGETFYVEVNASLVRDDKGVPLHIQTMLRDITERKESAEQYRALFENMHDAVLIIDLDGRTLMANPQAEAMLGYSLEELLAARTGSLLPEREAKDAKRRHAQLVAGEEVPPFERVIQRKNGEEITIEINMSLIRDANGEPLHVQSVFRDITERKRSALRYEALLESNQDSVVIFGLDGIILQANEMAAQMTGYTREELVGMHARAMVSPKEYQHLGEVQKRLLEGETLPRYQRVGIRKDGSEFVMEINMTVVWDEQGEPSHWQSISRDITERIRNEEETLVQSQITAHMTEGIMLVRASDDVIVYVNPTMRKMFGYDEGEMVGKHVWMLNSDETDPSQKISSEIARIVRQKGNWQGEIYNRKKSGEAFWTHASTTTIDHYEHGVVYLSTQVDITDRKRLEQELILQGAIARNLSESVNLVRASDQTIVYTNDRFDELFGYEPGEMIGRPVTDLNPAPPGEGVPRISDLYMHEVEVEGHWQGEILNVRKDGTLFWTLASIAEIEHPEHDKVYIATRVDITDRVETTNRLETTLAQLDHLIRSVNIVVYSFEVTEDYPTTYISDSVERIMGYPASRFLEDRTFYRQNVHPDDMPRLAESVFDPDALEQVIEYRYQRGDGEWIWLQDHIRMLTNEEGKIVEGLGVKVDITEARKAQENLNRAVRLAAGGEVAAGVAHQINNPLTIILAQASLIKGQIPPDSKLHSSLDIILRAIERAGKVVQRLLYMSKVLPYDYEPVDLNQTIESTAALIMAQFEADRSSIGLDLQPDLPPIWASESHLQDVWLNILINAKDAVSAGQSINVTITSRLIDDGENVEVRIEDDGPGIAQENLDSIFLPLYTTKPQHTGLGLPFCIEVVTRHGGIMEVDSALGQGATFIVTLPVERGQESRD